LVSALGNEQNDISAPGGFFRDFVGTPQNRTPGNLILGPYPKNVALASGTVDAVTGASLSPSVIAECSAPSIDACAYWQLIKGTSMAAPHVVGVAALIVSKYGDRDKKLGGRTLAPSKVERILYATATKVACPAPVITYAAEGRSPAFDAPCVGTRARTRFTTTASSTPPGPSTNCFDHRRARSLLIDPGMSAALLRLVQEANHCSSGSMRYTLVSMI
jgi:subtilisin family serine protease